MTNLERKRDYIISGSIDLQVEIYPVGFSSIADTRPSEPSEAIRARIIRARQIQEERFRDTPGIFCNAQMNKRLLNAHATLGPEALDMLRGAMERLDMSARAYDRILKVARTIADLDGSPDIQNTPHPRNLSANELPRLRNRKKNVNFVFVYG